MGLFDDDADEAVCELEQMDLDSVRGTLDELFLLARHYRQSDKFLDLMRFVASFRRYSAFNAMMVHIQMPGAKYVLPAKRWITEYERYPIADAQPLIMLQPMSPIMFGFDVSQTEGLSLPEGFDNPFQTHGHMNEGEFECVLENARGDGVKVNAKPLGSTLGGYVRNADSPHHCIESGLIQTAVESIRVDGKDIPVIAEITLNGNLPAETNFATLSHELAHLYCGHVGTPNPKWWPDRKTLDRNAKEFEAESVSYLVCRRAGIDTPAVEYLHCYLGANEEVPPISLDVVFKAAQRIESMRLKKLKPRMLEKEKT